MLLIHLAIGGLVFGFGSAIGSFLNVVVYRVPAGLSILHPPSRCPTCLTRLGKRENVPILGWLWLRGKCRHCHTAIAPRYPLVELATGLMFAGVYAQWGLSLEAIAAATLLSWLLALALIDHDTLTLPHSLTQSGLVMGLGFTLLLAWQQSGTVAESTNYLMSRIIGALVGLWGLDAIAFLGSVLMGRTAMGAGDAKLMAMVGAWLGWQAVLLSTFLGCVLGTVFGGSAIVLGWRDRAQPMPFGPYLALGASISLFWGERIVRTYLTLFFPFN
ncbi:MAG: prepilin peptidase [Spirulina sp. SIO3F2]|nr:prepilin peptidase [Spirulina sp. SIO3F2]